MPVTLYSKIVALKKKLFKQRVIPEILAKYIDGFFNNLHSILTVTLHRSRDIAIQTKDITRDVVIQTKDVVQDAITSVEDFSALDDMGKEHLVCTPTQIKKESSQHLKILYPLYKPFLFLIFFTFDILYAFFSYIKYRKFSINEASDKAAIKEIQKIIVNSENVKSRVQKYYSRESTIIYPPIEKIGETSLPTENFWLSVNRLTPEKRIELQIEAFNKKPDTYLVVVGGYDNAHSSYAHNIKLSANKNIIFMDNIDEMELKRLYSQCKGFITTAIDEDFGMSAVEAMAAGKPVIAPNEGGYVETIVPEVTGILIDNISSEKILEAIKEIDLKLLRDVNVYRRECIEQASRFNSLNFIKHVKEVIDKNITLADTKHLTFIVGVPRSGTTWLWGLLTSHPSIQPLLKSDLTGAEQKMRGQKYVSVETNMLFDNTTDEIKTAIAKKTKNFIIEKTPDHLLQLGRIKADFPHAKIIHIIRNPLDIYTSYKNSDWDRKISTVREWLPVYEKRISSFLKHKNEENMLTIRYEDLHRKSEKTIRQVFSFMGLTKKIDIKKIIKENKGMSKSAGKHSIRKGKINSWEKELEQREVNLIKESLKKYEFLSSYFKFSIAYKITNKIKNILSSLKKEKKLVFIVGIPRSGTTWLWKLLSEHKDVGVLTAYDFEDNPSKEKGYPLKETNMLFDFPLKTIKKVISKKKKINVIEKTPLHILKLDMIAKEFPKAKIIHVVRNPFSVYASYKFTENKEWQFKDINVEQWVKMYKEMFSSFADKINRPNIITVSYENILKNTEESLLKVYDFIALDSYNIKDAVKNSSYDKMFPVIHKLRKVNSLREKVSQSETEYIENNLKEEIALLKKIAKEI